MRSVRRRVGVVMALVVVLSTLLVPAASAAPAPAPSAQGQAVYWVRPGDTLYIIAARFGVSASAIAAANGLRNWNFIYVGQRLIIPYGAVYYPPAPPPTCGTCGAPVYYTVRYGDTLGIIAARYGTTWQYLAQLNGLANPNLIYAGRVLLITPGTPCYNPCPPSYPPPPYPPPPTGVCVGWNCPIPGPWTGNYFATPDLSGSPTVVRQDGTLDFAWGWNPPAAGMPNFNWSARWTTTPNMAGGTYRAWVSVDDGVRVYVDGTKIIDSWIVQAEAPYQQDFIVVPGVHTITVEYFQAQGVAAIHFRLGKVG